VGPIDPEASIRIQSELVSGESLLWSGRPNPGVIFHSDDWYMIPFSLLWGGFAIFWESMALGFWGHNAKGTPPVFMALWGVPFVVIGQYLIWGRFVYDGWLKRRTYYGDPGAIVPSYTQGAVLSSLHGRRGYVDGPLAA